MSFAELSDDQVLQGTRELVRLNKIRWKSHAEIRMAQRGFDRGQVRKCLLVGGYIERPIIPNKAGDIQYEFKIGATVDGMPIHVVASYYPDTKVVVITVIDPS